MATNSGKSTKEVDTLFDTVQQDDITPESPIELLRVELKKSLNDSVYKFKIHYNRVLYGKISMFPKGINKSDWLNEAETIWNSKRVRRFDKDLKETKLIYIKDIDTLNDPKKANQ